MAKNTPDIPFIPIEKPRYYVRIGYPLGIFQGKGYVENAKTTVLDKTDYKIWFMTNPNTSLEDWCCHGLDQELCFSPAAFDKIKNRLLEKHLITEFAFDNFKSLEKALGNAQVIPQGRYHYECNDKMIFSNGFSVLQITSDPLIKFIWEAADGELTLKEILVKIGYWDEEDVFADVKDALRFMLEASLILLKNNY